MYRSEEEARSQRTHAIEQENERLKEGASILHCHGLFCTTPRARAWRGAVVAASISFVLGSVFTPWWQQAQTETHIREVACAVSKDVVDMTARALMECVMGCGEKDAGVEVDAGVTVIDFTDRNGTWASNVWFDSNRTSANQSMSLVWGNHGH